MISLPPWANRPFELIVHAESHLRAAKDFDKRIALISYDNAIETAITTYLDLHPVQRGGCEYNKEDIEKWLKNYHSKLEFFEQEINSRDIAWDVEKSHIIWIHNSRNQQYHGGSHMGIPEESILKIARSSALWIFSVLFDVSDAESALEQAMLDQTPPAAPSREEQIDIAIDEEYGIVEVGEQSYYASELLFAIDPTAYQELGGKLCESINDSTPEAKDEVEP